MTIMMVLSSYELFCVWIKEVKLMLHYSLNYYKNHINIPLETCVQHFKNKYVIYNLKYFNYIFKFV